MHKTFDPFTVGRDPALFPGDHIRQPRVSNSPPLLEGQFSRVHGLDDCFLAHALKLPNLVHGKPAGKVFPPTLPLDSAGRIMNTRVEGISTPIFTRSHHLASRGSWFRLKRHPFPRRYPVSTDA